MAVRHDEPRGGLDPELLDAFADGELSRDEQRSVLLRLDSEPDGWRRLALAFVEAQRWRTDMRAVIDDSPRPPAGPLRSSDRPRRGVGRLARFVGPLLVTAAALAVGIFLGRSTGPDAGPRSLAVASNHDKQVPDENSAPHAGVETPGFPPPPAALPVARLGFTDPTSGEVRHVEAAVAGPPEAPILRLARPVSELPEGVRRSLERAAAELVTTQRVYPLRLQDGGHVVLIGQDAADVRLLTTDSPSY